MSQSEFGAVRRSGKTFELVFQRRIAKPLDKVWAALTVPERLADWLAQAEIDLRVGGRIELFWTTQKYRMKGVITALEPPRLFAWTWPPDDAPDSTESIVRWELAPDGGGCLLTLSNSGLMRDGFQMVELLGQIAGWHAHLEGLPGAADGVHMPWRAAREREIIELYKARLASGAL